MKKLVRIGKIIILAVAFIVVAFPFFWCLMLSFKSNAEIMSIPTTFFPSEWIVSGYKKAENTGCDMILSGHTHAGQIWPVGLFASLFHFDELNYGEQKQGNLDAIVTSGIAGWGYPIRTEKHSEYVVVNLIS